jgi:large subunit ribosomal protein L16
MATKKTNKKSLTLFPLNLPHKYYHKFLPKRGVVSLNNPIISTQISSVCCLRSLAYGRISSVQLDAGLKYLKKAVKKTGRVFLRVYPWQPLTKKPGETRMGKGKSRITNYVYPVKPGKIIFEIQGLDEKKALSLLNKVVARIAVASKVFTYKR